MKKDIESALIVVGIAVVAYLIYNQFLSNPVPAAATPAISDTEKADLFNSAMGYRGGAQPSAEILQNIQQNADLALQKIHSLGLDAEYQAFLNSQNQMGVPA